MFSHLQSIFNHKNTRFITIKDPNGKKFQTVGSVHDRIKKISNTYLIVRESNKENTDYHHHIIAILNETKILKRWFRKGIHMNVQKLSSVKEKKNPCTRKSFPLRWTYQQVIDSDDPVESSLIELHLLEQKVRDSIIKCSLEIKRQPHVQRILKYMSKDYTQRRPFQYSDYIYVKSNKHQVI